MAQTVVGLFDDSDHAQGAVKDFLKSDYPADKISIIATDSRGEFSQQPIATEPGNQAGAGAATGLISGAVVGGIFGLLVGVGVLLIPGVGMLAAGPIAMALAGAGIGAVGGGIIGALIGLGIPKDQVSTYAEAIRRGGCLVAVEANEMNIAQANKIMKDHGAVDIHQRAAYYQSQGFTNFDQNAPAYTQQQIAEDRARMQSFYQNSSNTTPPPPPNNDAVRSRYESQSSSQGLTYQQWEPAYRFGWQMSHEPQYSNYAQSEPAIRQMWEQSNPGTFDMYKQAIFAGFDDGYARRPGARLI